MTAQPPPPLTSNSSPEQLLAAVRDKRGKEVWQLLFANNAALLTLHDLENPSFLADLLEFGLESWCELLPPSALTTWAADCAEHVLPSFETVCPGDERLRSLLRSARTGTHDQALASATANLAAALYQRSLTERDNNLGEPAKQTLRASRAAVAATRVAASVSPEDDTAAKLALDATHFASLATPNPGEEITWQLSRLIRYLNKNLL